MNIARMQQTSRALQDLARLVDTCPSGDVALPNSNLLRDANLVIDELWVELNKERAKCARLNHLMDNMHELFGPEEDASESPSNLESTQECAQGVEPSNGPGVFPRSSEGLTGSARFARDGK